MAQGSLVSRLIWLLASSMAALWVLGSITAGALTVFEVNERLDDAIEEVAQRLLPATYEAVRQPEAMQGMAKQLVATMDPRALAYQIIGPTSEIAMRSENAPETPFPVPRQAGFHDTPQYRIYAQPAAADDYFIEVAEPRAHRAESLWRATALTVGPLLLFLPLLWFLIRWAVVRSMRSLDQLRSEIGRRDGSNLSQIPEMGLPTELAPIQTAVNRLLERLERALATERQFAANSAHELRTPIAAVLAQMQLLAAQLAGTQHAERSAPIVVQIKGLSSLAEKLLQLSRSGAGVGMQRERVDIMTVVQILVDEFRRHEDVRDRLVIAAEGPDEFIVQGELDIIGITLRNLIENAVRYGAPDEPIELVVGHDRQIRLLNGSAIIPSEIIETLRKPFVRGCSVGAGGGLGLAIVDSIMKQIGGSLTLISPVMGRASGFEARLVFPEPT
jgi:two-component system, OmpR family, sensor kinase